MRKWTAVLVCLVLALACAAAAAEVQIDEDTFPDKQFRAYVEENFDKNKDGKLSKGEITAAKNITCYSMGIESLKGIEVFTALTELFCADNKLTELDVSSNKNLIRLTCGLNQLTSLDLEKNTKLLALGFEKNQIEEIDLSGLKKLKTLSCAGNPMKTLDVSGCPRLASLVKNGEPAEYEPGFYGWWRKGRTYPDNYIFVDREMEVQAVKAPKK